MNYTPTDAQTLQTILEHRNDGEDAVRLSNTALAAALGISSAAAAQRLNRLEEMGVVHLEYAIDAARGRIIGRTIKVLQVPPSPWVPTR